MRNIVFSRQTVCFFLLILLIVLITLSFHPKIVDISEAAGYTVGTILSRYIILVYGLLFILCLQFKELRTSLFLRRIYVLFALLLFFAFAAFAFFNRRTMFGDVRAIGICIVATMIGWMLKLDQKQWQWMAIIYSVLTVFVGLMQVLVNIGGFVIKDQLLTDQKNSLGVLLASSAIIMLFFFLNFSGKRNRFRVMFLALCLASVVLLLTIRARASTLSFCTIAILVFLIRYKNSDLLLYSIVLLVIVSVIVLLLPSGFKEYIYNSFYQSLEGNFSSGRISRNVSGLNFLRNNFWLGGLNSKMNLSEIHNYLLNKICSYGVCFSIPIVILFFAYGIKSLLGVIKETVPNNTCIGYYVLLVPFVVAMAEPTLPFGPGTATVFNFIIFGSTLRYSSIK